MLGRFLVGVAGGAYCFNIPVYIGEIASKEIRGILVTLFQVFVELGVLIAYTLGSLFDLFTFNIVCGSFLIVYTTLFMFLPESPVFLMRKNDLEKAEEAIRILRGSMFDMTSEVLEYQDVNDERMKSPKKSFFQVLSERETRKAFLIIVCIFFFFQMSGINGVIFYTTQIFMDAGVTMDPAIATIITGFVQVVSTLSTAAFVDRLGRVFLLKISFSLMIIGLNGFGMSFFIKSKAIENFDWLPLTSLCVFVIGFSSGMGPVPFVLLGEIFSNDAKKVIAPFAQTLVLILSMMIGLVYPALVSSIGTGLTFFVFSGFCIAGLMFTIFVIPETKGKSLEEIQEILRK